MQVNRINNNQSFGMACSIGSKLAKAIKDGAFNIKQMEQLDVAYKAFESLPHDCYMGLSKNGDKVMAGLLEVVGEGKKGVPSIAQSFKKFNARKAIEAVMKDVASNFHNEAVDAANLGYRNLITEFIEKAPARVPTRAPPLVLLCL